MGDVISIGIGLHRHGYRQTLVAGAGIDHHRHGAAVHTGVTAGSGVGLGDGADGVGVLPWMLCGTNSIGEATAEKMKEFRLVIWGMHGIYGAGKTMDETFGLIETVEKAAQIYMLTAHLPRINTIRDEEMKELADYFKVNYRKDFLNL